MLLWFHLLWYHKSHPDLCNRNEKKWVLSSIICVYGVKNTKNIPSTKLISKKLFSSALSKNSEKTNARNITLQISLSLEDKLMGNPCNSKNSFYTRYIGFSYNILIVTGTPAKSKSAAVLLYQMYRYLKCTHLV